MIDSSYAKSTGHVTIVLLFLFLSSSPVQAQKISIEKQKNQVKSIQSKIESEQKKLEKVYNKEKSISSQLRDFDQNLQKLSKRIKTQKKKIENTQKNLERSEKEIKALQKQQKSIETNVLKYVQHLHRHGKPVSPIKISAKNDSRILNLESRFFKAWHRENYDNLLNNEKILKELSIKKQLLKKERESLKQSLNKLSKNQSNVQQTKRKKNTLLKQVRTQKKLYAKNIEEWRAAKVKMNKLLSQLRRKKMNKQSGFAKKKGQLSFPVQGKMFEKYGSYYDKKLKVKLYRKGIRIRAKLNSNVKVVAAGTVVYAGWFDGYGNVLIVDHGGGYFSLYAHLSEIFKGKNEKLKSEEFVAKVGRSGTTLQAHLYFELREKGLSIDPLNWFEKSP